MIFNPAVILLNKNNMKWKKGTCLPIHFFLQTQNINFFQSRLRNAQCHLLLNIHQFVFQ
jgi:hypothetical protein